MQKSLVTGPRIKEVRKKRGYTQEYVAREIGISRSTVASWETGVREPSVLELIAFCELFGVSFDYMCGRTDAVIEAERPAVYNIRPEELNAMGKKLLYEFYTFLKENEPYKK